MSKWRGILHRGEHESPTARRRLFVEPLEKRLVLSTVVNGTYTEDADDGLDHHAVGNNWLNSNDPHDDHITFTSDTNGDTFVTLKVLVHSHRNNLSGAEKARINDAIAEINSAQTNFDVNLKLVTTTKKKDTHQIHVHKDSSSGCGPGALGCAEFAYFTNHSGTFGDGHGNHLYAGEDTPGGTAEVTILNGFDWYTGSDPNGIGANQYDFETVVVQELGHEIGLGHDATVYSSDPETVGNTDRRSAMHGSLGTGIVRRFLTTHDQELLDHFYGTDVEPPDDGGNGGNGKGPPPGKGKNKIIDVTVDLDQLMPVQHDISDFSQTWPTASSDSTNIGIESHALSVEPTASSLTTTRELARARVFSTMEFDRANDWLTERSEERNEPLDLDGNLFSQFTWRDDLFAEMLP